MSANWETMGNDVVHVKGTLWRHDPFVGMNSEGVIYAETPCWSLIAMPVPDIHTPEAEERKRQERRRRGLIR
jgi:hypothetical protein